ncbi:hypothetical protein [Roseateles rivi]|uniref:primase 1D-like protein n=1 Tax=Roseateles rivi TaxID=3299028 RepID=UPI003B0107DC
MNIGPIKTHPYWHVRDLINSWRDRISHLYLSYYEYIPQSVEDPRTELTITTSQFIDPVEIQNIIDATPEGHELAFHSRVHTTSGQFMHIPLIDMSTGSAAQLEKLRPFLGDLFNEFHWYTSGRSFHGYSATVVNFERWASIMGFLLLANQKGLPPTVDPRWIGHRLIAGYSALRWTKNTKHYLEVPQSLSQARRLGVARGAASQEAPPK